jgi:TPR repeat protein
MPKIKLPRKIRDLVKKANAGSGDAAWDLYVHYLNGTGGVEENHELARHWVERGAELGCAGAQCVFGYVCEEAGDYERAREWYERAAAQGATLAEYNLGLLYDLGLGVERDLSKAAEFYHRAALKGDVHAQHNYGYLLDRERNDYEGAMKWYEKAAAQGDAQAEYHIGTLYFAGQGVERDEAKAREWWERAAAHGHEVAKEALEDISMSYTHWEKDWADAVARDETDAEAMNTLNEIREEKRDCLLSISELGGLKLSDDAVELFVTEIPADHEAYGLYQHIGLCFFHGRCGLEKNLRMAKEVFKVAEIRDGVTAAVAKELVKLRSCVTCGKTDARWGCKLCRGVRYCNKRCQQRDWNRGDPPHKETCSRVVHMFPPGSFAELREKVAKEKEESA